MALNIASLPDVVHSERSPIVLSIFSTLAQLSILSSATNARKPFNSLITPLLLFCWVVLNLREIVNSDPTPNSLFTLIVPPIISTIFFVIAIPSPVPGIRLTVEVSSLVNGSKICSANSSLIPIPLSFTTKS